MGADNLTCKYTLTYTLAEYVTQESVIRTLHRKHPYIFWELFVLSRVGIYVEHSSLTSKIQAVYTHGKEASSLYKEEMLINILWETAMIQTVLEIHSESLVENILICFFNDRNFS